MKKDKVGVGLILFSIIVIILMLSAPKIMGVTTNWYLPVTLQENADTIFLVIRYMDGTLVDSVYPPRTSTNSYDTTIIIDEDSSYMALFKIKYTGSNYTPWIFYNNRLTQKSNIAQISGDATAADNFETMLDGTGGNTLSLGRMVIYGANGSNGSLDIVNTSVGGIGVKILGDSTVGIGVQIEGYDGVWIDANGRHGIFARGNSTGSGAYFVGGSTSGDGLYLRGNGTGKDLYLYNDGGEFSPQSIWDVGFGTAFTAGSMGDSLNNATYVQGSASGLTAEEVADTMFNRWNPNTDYVNVSEKLGDNLIKNSGFEIDSVAGSNDPYNWTQYDGVFTSYCGTNPTSSSSYGIGKWEYLIYAFNAADTFSLYQPFGEIETGIYELSVSAAAILPAGRSIVLITNSSVGARTAGCDSIIIDASAGYSRVKSKMINIESDDEYYIWLYLMAWSYPTLVSFDDISFKLIGSDSWAGTGSGSNDWYIYVADAADTSFINNAKVTVRTMAGSADAVDYTDSFGKVEFTIDPDSFTVQVEYVLASDGEPDTIDVLVNPQTDTVYITTTTLPTAGAPDLAALSVIYYKGGNIVLGAKLMVSNENVATDTVQNVIIGPFFDWDRTNASGLATVEVPKSYVYHDSLKSLYDISLVYRGKAVYQWKDYYVPNQDTVRLEVVE